MWKAVRADWLVEAPYHWWEKGSDSYGIYPIELPIKPIWRSPQPNEINPYANNWDDIFPGGGAYGITGPPVLRPNWELIGAKLIGAFIIASLLGLVLPNLFRHLIRAAKTPIVENDSKGTNC